jgi:hypothetical protein
LGQEMTDNVDKEAVDAGNNEQHQQQADDKWVFCLLFFLFYL